MKPSILLAAIAALTLTACAGPQTQEEADAWERVADSLKQAGGDINRAKQGPPACIRMGRAVPCTN